MLISYYPNGSKIIRLSIGTELSEGRVTKVRVDMAAREELLPSSTEYLKESGLLQEVLSKAGLNETIEFSTYTQTSYKSVGNHEHVYRLELTVAV